MNDKTLSKPGLTALGNFLPGVLSGVGINSKNYALAEVIERQILQIAPRARIVGFKNNKFYVEVESSVELQELNFRRGEVFKSLRDTFPIDGLQAMPEIKIFIRGLAHPGVQDRIYKPAAPEKKQKSAPTSRV